MTTNGEIVTGTEIEIPLNKLKKSPRNARKVPHSDAAIEALAASIGAKKLLQKPVVEPERDDAGGLTGFWLVTIGEGRRLALRMLAARGQIKKAHLVPCVIDTEFDPQEISLDENVTRSAMHPADQFDAFRDLNERLGWSTCIRWRRAARHLGAPGCQACRNHCPDAGHGIGSFGMCSKPAWSRR